MMITLSNGVSICLLAAACVSGACSAPQAKGGQPDDWGVQSYDDLESLRAGTLWASEWWHVDVRGTSFAVCLQEFPSYGQSRQGIQAWRRNADGSWELVWSFRAVAVGPVEVHVDASAGTVSVRAKGNTEFKDAVIAFTQLGATSG